MCNADRKHHFQANSTGHQCRLKACPNPLCVAQPGVEMNAGFTAALAGLSEAPLNWERCSQVDDWVRTRRILPKMPLRVLCQWHLHCSVALEKVQYIMESRRPEQTCMHACRLTL